MHTFTLGTQTPVTLDAIASLMDHALISACVELSALEQAGGDEGRIAELRAGIAATPARTEEGMQAKAAARPLTGDDVLLVELAREVAERRIAVDRKDAEFDALPLGAERTAALKARLNDTTVAEAYHQTMAAVADAVARTPAGFQAKARIYLDQTAGSPHGDEIVPWSIARDILAGGVPVPPLLLDTPISALARRYDDADRNGWDGNIEALPQAQKDLERLCREACEHPATTLADAAFQLYAAFGLTNGLAETVADIPENKRDLTAIEKAVTSALRVMAAHLGGTGAAGLENVPHMVACHWEGVLPPVLLAHLPPESADDEETGRRVDEAIAMLPSGDAKIGISDAEAERDIGLFDRSVADVLARRSHTAGMRHKLRLLGAYGGAGDDVRDQVLASISADLDALPVTGQVARPQDDADIVSAAASYIDLELAFLRLHHGPDALPSEDERDAADEASRREERQAPFAEILSERRATTPAGWRAKALAAYTAQPDLLNPAHGVMDAITTSLLKDLVGSYEPVMVAEGTMPPATLGDAVPHPDAELIAACQEYEAVDRRWCAIIDAGGHTPAEEDAAEKQGEPLERERSAILHRLCEMRAVTPDGLAARAKLLSYNNGDWASSWERGDGSPGAMLEALLRDASSQGGRSPAPEVAA